MNAVARPQGKFVPNPKLKLREQLAEVMRFKHFSHRTENAYWHWIKGFILFHRKRHPRELGAAEVQAYLAHLARDKQVAAATQNQALNGLVFLYREVLGLELGSIGKIERPTRTPKVPTVLTKGEVRRVLAAVAPEYQLACQLLYGTGMRLLEGLRLRVKDVDFERHEIVIHDGKGAKDRVTMLPERLKPALQAHLERVKAQHEKDLAEGHGRRAGRGDGTNRTDGTDGPDVNGAARLRRRGGEHFGGGCGGGGEGVFVASGGGGACGGGGAETGVERAGVLFPGGGRAGLGDFGDFVRARKRTRVPVVLNRAECERLFEAMEAIPTPRSSPFHEPRSSGRESAPAELGGR